MKKSFIAVSAAAAAMLSSAVYAQDITVTVDGKNVEFDQPPVSRKRQNPRSYARYI